jgi:hypothetical protein
LASTGPSGANVASSILCPLLQRRVDQELTPTPARSGQSLALQIGGRLDRRILANQNGLRAGVGAGAPDGLDRRTCGIDGEKRQIAGVTDVECARIECFENRRRCGKLRPFDSVRKILRQSRDFEKGAIATLLIANRSVTASAASADAVIANPNAAPNSVAPKLRRRARALDSSLIAFMFLAFSFHPQHWPEAISDGRAYEQPHRSQ